MFFYVIFLFTCWNEILFCSSFFVVVHFVLLSKNCQNRYIVNWYVFINSIKTMCSILFRFNFFMQFWHSTWILTICIIDWMIFSSWCCSFQFHISVWLKTNSKFGKIYSILYWISSVNIVYAFRWSS